MPYLNAVRYFNTEGPVKAQKHYSIPPLSRVDLDEIHQLIEWEKYFVLHAPRQTGKTSMLLELADRLNAGDSYRCVYIDVEVAHTAGADVAKAIPSVLSQLALHAARMLGDKSVDALRREVLAQEPPSTALTVLLARWCAADAKPLVLLVDEIDTMIGDSLISVLRQLRAGYFMRPGNFPQSVILCGVRDVRDYRIFSDKDQHYTSGGSAFNIKAKSLRLGDFSESEVQDLLAQHTAETGQAFEARSIERIWELTRGQPWLVNALAQQACFEDQPGRNRSRAIGDSAIDDSKETLILERVTHLDQLASTLREDRVRRVVEPMLADSEALLDVPEDDLDYVCDLGLVRDDGAWGIANPIYREVIPRQLTYAAQGSILRRAASFVDGDGKLDMPKLMADFQAYFRLHSEAWGMGVDYKEARAQLLLHAFLQKVFNGGGRIEREYAMGRGRTDLLVQWPLGGRWGRGRISKHVIECKVLRSGRGSETTIEQGVQQTSWYMDRCGAESGHLLIFDQRPGKSWTERIFRREEWADETAVTVWGM